MRPRSIYGLIAAVIVLPILAAYLGGCTPPANGVSTLTPQAQSALANLCKQDAALQPVAAASAVGAGAVVAAGSPAAGAAIGAGVALDQSTLHPLVQDACAKLPAAVTPAATPAKS